MSDLLHFFKQPVHSIPLPEQFTYPFHYTPHPLSRLAVREVQEYLEHQTHWHEELEKGKMFGVLIVRTPNGETGFLAAFSGNLAKRNNHPYFVPPIYDLLRPEGFFKIEEENISLLNERIRILEQDPQYRSTLTFLKEQTASADQEISAAKQFLKEEKIRREERRLNKPDETERALMIRESQFQKAELKRLEKNRQEQIERIREEIAGFEEEIGMLKAERKERSAKLQLQLFNRFRILNNRGETKGLSEIFSQTVRKTPPAGAGECAGPKLLQYAYLHDLKPLAMAEFWWGNSPKTEIRHHGNYYPACKGKCEPILSHMLQGLDVEANPLNNAHRQVTDLKVLFEDEWLMVIDKPSGLLSVPGKSDAESVYTLIKKKYPDATGPLIVHRLDMATSGLLLITKHKEAHKILQAQFKERTVSKKYIALLEGRIERTEGIIDLPLCPDPIDRPRQVVDAKHGKPAVTRFEVIGFDGKRTRIAYYPLTGRTHQLRVHSAHPAGLNTPIAGDELYGQKAERLYLHAEYLEFSHPITHERIGIERKAEF